MRPDSSGRLRGIGLAAQYVQRVGRHREKRGALKMPLVSEGSRCVGSTGQRLSRTGIDALSTMVVVIAPHRGEYHGHILSLLNWRMQRATHTYRLKFAYRLGVRVRPLGGLLALVPFLAYVKYHGSNGTPLRHGGPRMPKGPDRSPERGTDTPPGPDCAGLARRRFDTP